MVQMQVYSHVCLPYISSCLMSATANVVENPDVIAERSEARGVHSASEEMASVGPTAKSLFEFVDSSCSSTRGKWSVAPESIGTTELLTGKEQTIT